MSLKKQDFMPHLFQPAVQGRADPVTFEDLLVAVGATQNRDAFIRLFEYFAPRVKSFLIKGGAAPDLADDLAQETMLTLWQKAPTYDPRLASASTWIFTIARNKRIDALRKAAKPSPDAYDPAFQPENPLPADAAFSQREESKAVSAALKTLPPEQADLVRMAFFEDKTHSAIAAATSLPLGTVKSRLRLAMERLRRGLVAEASS